MYAKIKDVTSFFKRIEDVTSFLKRKTKRNSTPGQKTWAVRTYKRRVAWNVIGEEPNIQNKKGVFSS